jgi:hypothetical protein
MKNSQALKGRPIHPPTNTNAESVRSRWIALSGLVPADHHDSQGDALGFRGSPRWGLFTRPHPIPDTNPKRPVSLGNAGKPLIEFHRRCSESHFSTGCYPRAGQARACRSAVPTRSNPFQPVPTRSNPFQPVPTRSNVFQRVPTCSNVIQRDTTCCNRSLNLGLNPVLGLNHVRVRPSRRRPVSRFE